MILQFTKMHGCGNDFIVIDGIHQDLSQISTAQWQFLADRHFGIGADQILLVENSSLKDVDFKYRIINHDGTEVEQCGNGSRCFVRFVREKALSNKKLLRVEVRHAVLTLQEFDNGLVEVNMGKPILTHNEIPFEPGHSPQKTSGHINLYQLIDSPVPEKTPIWISTLSMGNPHAVIIVDSCQDTPVLEYGPIIEHHPAFIKRVNVGFMEILSRHEINLRVFERGSGETLSCGTGACAAAVSGILQNLLESPVTVNTRGGVLNIYWDFINLGQSAEVFMTGPAKTVFDGKISLPEI